MEQQEKLYTFVNWGDKVYHSKLETTKPELAVITSIDRDDQCKIVYQTGGFNWVDRDELEAQMEARELVEINLLNSSL